MKSILTYSLIFGGAFLVTVWLRRPEVAPRSATPGVTLPQATPAAASAMAAELSSRPVRQATPPIAVARLPEMPVDDPRDAIPGDVYPVVAQVTAAADAVPAAQPSSLRTPGSAPVLSRPASQEEDQQRDAIAGDAYPFGQYTGSSVAR
jgi:hypothetical protein